MQSSFQLAPGARVGPYEIVGSIGRGGMAEVYKVRHGVLGRFEALKVPLPGAPGTQEQSFAARFISEAQLAASLDHPNIARVYGASDANAPQPYFAMEFVEGVDLDSVLEARRVLTPAQTLAILQPVAAALDYAHAQGILHRDIKPANLLLRGPDAGPWQPKVADFGIARAFGFAGQSAENTRLTSAGHVVGTVEYISPEIASGAPQIGPASDLYSLGVVAYQMLCGAPPFVLDEGASKVSVLIKHVTQTPPAPTLAGTPLPRALSLALLSALEKDPAARPTSCGAWVEMLRAAIEPRTPIPWKPIAGAAAFATACLLFVALTRSSAVPAPAPVAPNKPAAAPAVALVAPPPGPSEKARDLALQSRTLVDKGVSGMMKLNDLIDEKKIMREDALKKQDDVLIRFRRGLDLSRQAVKMDAKCQDGWLQMCRAKNYLGRCDAPATMKTARQKFPENSQLEALQAIVTQTYAANEKAGIECRTDEKLSGPST